MQTLVCQGAIHHHAVSRRNVREKYDTVILLPNEPLLSRQLEIHKNSILRTVLIHMYMLFISIIPSIVVLLASNMSGIASKISDVV